MKNALDHITEKNVGSRTILFNALMATITTFLLAISIIFEESYPIAVQILPPTLILISSVGNIILYGMTHVKHSGNRNV